MYKKQIKGFVGIALTSAVAFGIAFGLNGMRSQEQVFHGIELEGNIGEVEEVADNSIQGIAKVTDKDGTISGYVVTVKEQGYGGDMEIDVALSADAKKILGVSVGDNQETEGIGTAITEKTFLDQFQGMDTPIYMEGMASTTTSGTVNATNSSNSMVLKDGTYLAKAQEADDNGLTEQVEMVVEGGKITEVVWDCVGEDGTTKRKLADNGQYVMTEDGLTWTEQANALAQTIIENQSLDAVGMNEQGKTDAVAGVSIYIGSFVSLVEQCLEQAGGEKTAGEVQQEEVQQEGTKMDAISGATISSKAVVRAIDKAYTFVVEMNK